MTCTAYRDELVAFADHALTGRAREVVAAHVMRCDDCRAELAELRRVRSVLATSSTPVGAPSGLAERLLAIAGDDKDRSLCLARDDQRTTGLPSLRQQRRRRTAVGSSVAALAAGGALGGAWLLAPELPGVADPDGSSVLPPAPAASASLLSGVTSSVPDCPHGYLCPPVLDGLALVRVVVDDAAEPRGVRLDYGDGPDRVAVVQQRGMLACDPASIADQVVWQSSDVVFSVSSTDAQRTARVVPQLPHEEPVGDLYRVKAGLRSLVGHRGR